MKKYYTLQEVLAGKAGRPLNSDCSGNDMIWKAWQQECADTSNEQLELTNEEIAELEREMKKQGVA